MREVHAELFAAHAKVRQQQATVIAINMQRMFRLRRARRHLEFLRVKIIAVARGNVRNNINQTWLMPVHPSR